MSDVPSTPATPSPGSVVKRVLVGRAVSSAHLEHTLLPKWLALPVFSSDALSSVAYASEEILRVLLIASVGAAAHVTPIAIAIGALMIIVVASYRQTVRAYPSGGGAYIVSKENLGQTPGLIAASALLVDYMMTVVGVGRGRRRRHDLGAARPRAVPRGARRRVRRAHHAREPPRRQGGRHDLRHPHVLLHRRHRRDGRGRHRPVRIGGCPVSHLPRGSDPEPDLATGVRAISLFVILRAFSSGATALTGVEAISNGVPAFRRPQARNAAETLAIMGGISVTMFLGISFLTRTSTGSRSARTARSSRRSRRRCSADRTAMFYVVQAFTAAILVLAANTAYQDFPRLASILARDRFMPRAVPEPRRPARLLQRRDRPGRSARSS